MPNSCLRVIEIFSSLQGEGREQGYPAVFVRCAGCNLSCRWCDTPESHVGGRVLRVEEVIGRVQEWPHRRVTITGGEPLLQMEAVVELARGLADAARHVEIETNGTISFEKVQPYAAICMDVKCPSSGEESDLSLLQLIRDTDTVKFVVGDEDDCRYAAEVAARHQIQGEIIWSPVWGSDYNRIARFILEHGLDVRFQLQLHRLVGVP
ncbi:MAG: 7-carboxy-7-deazaguanine synthase QueE [Methanoculleaceae archaeon]